MKNQHRISLVVVLVAFLFVHDRTLGQHCPPITDSYLSTARVQRTKEGLSFKIGYSKTGGQYKTAYQAYILAYSVGNSEKIAELTPQQAIENGLVSIVHTQVAPFAVAAKAPRAVQQTDGLGEYQIDYKLNTKQFVEKMLATKLLENSKDIGGWKRFDDELRLAVFIPFLDDEKYSTLEGLPKDKHECNYQNSSALLFQPLTQKLTVSFGVVRAFKLPEGDYFIELNGKRGRKATAR